MPKRLQLPACGPEEYYDPARDGPIALIPINISYGLLWLWATRTLETRGLPSFCYGAATEALNYIAKYPNPSLRTIPEPHPTLLKPIASTTVGLIVTREPDPADLPHPAMYADDDTGDGDDPRN